jgi:Zn-dependent peptidase ImmA (M78 family)
MKLRIGKKGISVGTFKLTQDDIEQQVANDLLRYNNLFRTRYGMSAAVPLDVESFIKELWGIEVEYDEFPQNDDEEILGLFEPEKQRIIVDPKMCNNKGRISFTVAHEAGHLSLHSFLFTFNYGKTSGWQDKKSSTDKKLDRQADLYAASLLAPKQKIYEFLKENKLSDGTFLISPIDLTVYASPFQERFGLSRQALEIRLSRMGLSMINRKYQD